MINAGIATAKAAKVVPGFFGAGAAAGRTSGVGGMGELRANDQKIVVWWGTRMECPSAIARLERMGELDEPGGERARTILESLSEARYEIEPAQGLRELACGLLRKHETTSADGLQLAAALCTPWRGPKTIEFVCLDRRLARAAEREGLRIAGN